MTDETYLCLRDEIVNSRPSFQCKRKPLPACCWCLADGWDWCLTDSDVRGHGGLFTMDDDERRMFCLFCLEAT